MPVCMTVHVGTLEQLQVLEEEKDTKADAEEEECSEMTGKNKGKMEKMEAKKRQQKEDFTEEKSTSFKGTVGLRLFQWYRVGVLALCL